MSNDQTLPRSFLQTVREYQFSIINEIKLLCLPGVLQGLLNFHYKSVKGFRVRSIELARAAALLPISAIAATLFAFASLL